MKLNRNNKLLFISFPIALYICYSFAISNTIKYYIEFRDNNFLISSNNSSPRLTLQLRQKEKQLDFLINKYNISNTESFQNNLLKQLSSYTSFYHLKIIDFKEPHISAAKGISITSYIFSVEGTFNGCLSLINKIENNPNLGSIKHINFIKKKDYKTNVDQLFAEIIIQKNKQI